MFGGGWFLVKAGWMIWKSEMATYIYTVKPPFYVPYVSYYILFYQLREANRSGWLHATGVYRLGDDKADFHATGSI